MSRSPLLLLSVFALPGLLSLAGCEDTTTPSSSMRARQDAALRDPFSYKPDMRSDQNISGGGFFDLDKKALSKDMKSVFDP